MVARHLECDTCSHCVDLHGMKDSDPKEIQNGRAGAFFFIRKWLEDSYSERTMFETQFLQA